MSTAYEMISESLNEIIKDLEENDGKNLKRETLSLKTSETKETATKKISNQSSEENFFEPIIRC